MSIFIQYEDSVCKQRKFENKTAPAPNYHFNDYFGVGECLERTFEDIANCGWQENPDFLNTSDDAISIIEANDEKCVFATDLTGANRLFYYHAKKQFIISDNIWDIAVCIQPTFEDINKEWVRKRLVCFLEDENTVLKDVHVLLPCHIGIYDAQTDSLTVKRYRYIQYSAKVSNIDEAVERLDGVLNKRYENIARKYGSNTKIGLGISGGLDSRVVAHYAKKAGLNLVGFNVCVPRPNKLFLAKSCMSAMELAKVFEVPLTLIEWKPETLHEKLLTRLEKAPLVFGRNIFKYESADRLEFDIMLNGGPGYFVGDSLPFGLDTYSTAELLSFLVNDLILKNSSISLYSRCIRGFNILFPMFNLKYSSQYPMILSLKEMENITNEFKEQITEMQKYGCSIFDVCMNFKNLLSSSDQYGARESQFGNRHSIAVYQADVYRESLEWSPSLFFERTLLNRLIESKIPEVKSIATEGIGIVTSSQSSGYINRIQALCSRLIRGNGTAIDEHSFNNLVCKKEFEKCFKNNCKWFNDIVKIDYDTINKKEFMRLVISIWEMKTLLDYIENREYMNITKQ